MTDDKIKKWLDEDLDIQTKEEHVRKSYDKKIVAWLDILGIRNAIKNEKKYDAESIIDIMSKLASYVSAACDKYLAENKLHYIQIADGFMIAADLSLADQICSIIAEIQWKVLVNLRMLSRGAITAGNVSVYGSGNLIIGPAYVDAYAMESENAIYARVILSDAFLKETKGQLTFAFAKEDADKMIYIDYIHYIMDTQKYDSKRMEKLLVEQGVYKEIKNSYETLALSVKQKHGWTMALFERNKISHK